MSPFVRTLRISLLALAALALASSASADDRQLLRKGSGNPYVMILFDTSGSMNWAPKCSAQQVADGICTYLCPTGDCPVPRDGDDPSSKFRQAKEALYEVLRSVDNIDFGFATYNQDQLRVQYKEWLYQVDATQAGSFISLVSGAQFPLAGSEDVLGQTYACDRGNGDAEIGCYANNNRAADTNDIWEMTKVRRLPKLGDDLTASVEYWIRDAGQVYRVLVTNPTGSPQTLGATSMSLRYRVYQCTGSPADNPSNGCNSAGEYSLLANGDQTITYTQVGPFVKWDYQVSRNTQQGGYDGVQWSSDTNTCAGWDPNDDTASDQYNGYSLRFPTTGQTFDPPGTADDHLFTLGDVIPLDWISTHKLDVLNRLAPRLNGADGSTDPEAFSIATYLNDHELSGQAYLRLKNESLRPLMPAGSTPLGYALGSIRTWYRGCLNGTCPGDTGWDDIASAQDPNWECRQKYLLVITDGDDTCPGRDPCSLTASMHALDDITTYVVAFGVENTPGNKLNCMASNGGSGEPIYPQNKQELVDALTNIFTQIQEETVAFASAAVPTVQANIADKVYLSSFTPLNRESVWPGRLDAFLKPLPLDSNGLPDRSTVCVEGSVEAQCWAWDAGDSQPAWNGETGYAPRGFLLQTPLEGNITRFDSTTLQIGTADDQRRVFFGLPDSTTAGKRQWFRYPADAAEQLEYEYVWNLPPPLGSTANRDTIAGVVEFTLKQKQGEIDNPLDPTNPFHIQYVLGDIFHSNPVVLNAPGNFDYYTKDLYWNTPLCGADLPTTQLRGPQISYDWFSNKNLCRRVMLLVGSDDGQLHAFDGGIFRGTDCKLALPPTLVARDATIADNDGLDGKYDFGTGKELFSFIPSAQMPLIKQLSEVSSLTDEYGIDNSARVGDVFIDPILDSGGNPTCQDRQWRTVVLGSYREGGAGIFALDITQPDTIDSSDNVPTPLGGASTGYVPSCINGGPDCGPLPFPSMLWEFKDTSDEDGVGGADEAESWSRPIIGRVQVCEGACDQPSEPEDRYVAIFGGGLPENPVNSSADASGNWVYMVDIETGRILYKRGGDGVISGSVAADVTGVDVNVDGYVDTLYFGTTAGYVYKVDLGNGPFELGVDGRIQDPAGDAGAYDPFQVFSTGGRPIYLEISAVFVPKLRANALLFGTGDRWNLWDFTGATGRFYAIVDTGWHDANRDGVLDPVGCATCTQPLTEASIQPIDPDAPFDLANPGPNYLFGDTGPGMLPGWYFPLLANEKLITEPFSLAGITFFTIYDPTNAEVNGVCALGGESKLFTVNTVNATGYAVAAGTTDYTRYVTAPKFTTQPFTEQSATGNQGGSGGQNADQWTDELRQINKELKTLFPADCRFANYTLDIKTIRSDTGIVFIAPVPICIEGHNWKEY
jgi:Tfp pilus tip-associated adhesin PilY1